MTAEERIGDARRRGACAVAWTRGGLVFLVCGIAMLLWAGPVASLAWASEEHYEQMGEFPLLVQGEEALGVLPLTKESKGVATNDATHEVYVADGPHARVERFDAEGGFLGAWGWNVIKTGPGKAGTSFEEEVTIKRTSGGEDVVYKGQIGETNPLSYEAPASEVERELDEHLMIGSEKEGPIKGEIKVEKKGSGVYKFTYEGALGDELTGSIGVVKDGLEGTISTKEQEGSPAFEDCMVASGDICRKSAVGTRGGNPGEFSAPESVAVDQANGDVYVLDSARTGEGAKYAVQVFESKGEPTGVEFGEVTTEKVGKVGEPEKRPEVLRNNYVNASIAADSEGNSYIVNQGPSLKEESRVSVFDSTGKYVESLARECGSGFEKGCGLRSVAVDSSGDVYTIGQEEIVYEFQRDKPDEPVCKSPLIKNKDEEVVTYESLAVGGQGEVIASSGKQQKFYWLDACNQEGQLTEDADRSFEDKTISATDNTTELAWNPTLEYGPPSRKGYERVKGVLYAINPASNSKELNTGLIFAGPEVPEATPPLPKVLGGSASDVGSTYATLNASVEPYPDPIHYGFMYYGTGDLKCSQFHECEAPVAGAELGANGEAVSETVSGLVPGVAYHFHVVGYSLCNPTEPRERCPLTDGAEHEQEFTTFPAVTELPDGRAYELVSPPSKDGGEVFTANINSIDCFECLTGVGDEKFPMQSTPNGEEMVYEGLPFAATGDAVDENQYLATRTGGGWTTRDLSPATAAKDVPVAGYKVFSPDLSSDVFVQTGLALSAEAPPDYPNVYLQSTAAPGEPRPLWTRADAELAPPHRGTEGTGAEALKFLVGGMAEGHVIFAANDALTPKTASAPPAVDGGAEAYNLYDWVNGELRLVNVLPGDGTTQPGAVFGSGTELETEAGDPDYSHAISADGSHVFWTDDETHRVYVRVDGEETIPIPPDLGRFLTASGDGSEALLSEGYIYDLKTEETTDLTDGKGGFSGILGASEDLSKVYFIDSQVLTGTEEKAYGSGATMGGNNLYLWQEGSPTRFIATLGGSDDEDGGAWHLSGRETGDWTAPPSDRTAQVTPDGGYAAFMSEADLTGYDNISAGGQCAPSHRCLEVFEYDAQANTLTCASCNPTNERPVGASTLSLIKPGTGFMAQPSNLTDNGRLFFDSVDALSPAVQHPGTVESVYEYEPAGLEDPDRLVPCRRVGGCIFMISSGADETDSSFVNATPSGGDVFFTTRSRLVPQDQDDLMDLYDAREGGGFAAEAPAQPCAESEACQGQPPASSSSPLFEMPPSAPPGVGNVLAPAATHPPPPSPPRPLTRAQLLAKALGACRRSRASHAKRLACERSARGRYGAAKKATSVGGHGHRAGKKR